MNFLKRWQQKPKGISGEQAWQNVGEHRHSWWPNILDRFESDFITVVSPPKFKLSADDKFFCIGSCFARELEMHLIYRGVTMLSKQIVAPRSEYPHTANGIANKFTTASMLNELEWLFSPWPQNLLIEGPDGWLDFQLALNSAVSHERAIERRRYIIDNYFGRIRDADVVVISLGLTEAWFDTETGIHLNIAPRNHRDIERYPGRFRLHRTNAAENIACLRRIRQLIKELSPRCRIVLTVSPVPMIASFTGEDVMVANTYSKSVLRVAAQALMDEFDDVDYFPSYEMTMLSRRDDVYNPDCVHVSEEFIATVIGAFLQSRIGDLPREFPEFTEWKYLQANPDVDEAVRRGEVVCGYHHWVETGRRENRALARPDAPLRPAGMFVR